MPHLFVKTKITPAELVHNWQENYFRLGDVQIKIQQGYVHPDGNKALFPCLVIEPFHQQWCYVEVRQRDKSRFLINLDPISTTLRTAGVRLALAWFGQNIAQLDTESDIQPGNLGEYINLLLLASPQQPGEFARLRQKLQQQLQAAQSRCQAKQFLLSLDGSQPPLSWQTIFANDQPVEIEIGPGKGKFLLAEAQAHPKHNFLAIEWAGRYLKVLSERLPKTNLTNVRLLVADARRIFQTWIPVSSIARLHVYYPDPWWKRKHEKHRLFTEDFLHSVENGLAAGGQLLLATDVSELFTEICSRVQTATNLLKIEEIIYRQDGTPPPGYTHFEIKKWQSGSEIYSAKWQKASQP